MPDESDAPASGTAHLPVTLWAQRKGTPPARFRAAAAGRRWEISPQVVPTETTEAEFDAAIAALDDRL